MASWILKDDGDLIERTYADDIGRYFPLYEEVWVKHVIPLTYRVIDRRCLYVRANLDPNTYLERMATGSYGTFIHLAACHDQLNSLREPELFARQGAYDFYSRLYSAAEVVVGDFLPAVNKVVEKFGGSYVKADAIVKGDPKWKRFQTRFRRNGRSGLYRDFDKAFGKRVNPYRNQRVHRWGFPAMDAKIPKRKFLDKWIGRGLGEIARFRHNDRTGRRLAIEFVPALDQARDDLRFVEQVLNAVWEMVLQELANLGNPNGYKNAQRVRSSDGLPPGYGSVVGSSTPATSGIV
jgi:hypothetical protein